MKVDAHQHFWRIARGDYFWLSPSLSALYRDFEAHDLKPLLDAAGIDATVLVQAAATVAETRHLLSLADLEPWILGVVGWVDFDQPEQAIADLQSLCNHKKLVGIRPMIQDIKDTDWMLQRSLDPVFEELIDHDLAFDALVKPPHLECLVDLLARHPRMAAVVDHAAKPEIARGRKGAHFDHWSKFMRILGRDTAAFCKLSGLVTEADHDWTKDDLRPYVDVLLESFGPSRLMFGSDWPVLLIRGTYEGWHLAATELLSALSPTEKAAVFGATAARFYRLRPRQPG